MTFDREQFTAAVGIHSAEDYSDLRYMLRGVPRDLGRLCVGLLMSEKTGLLGVPNRHGQVYPDFATTERIVTASELGEWPELGIVLHYNTDNPDQIAGQLERALAPIAQGIDGVQVNGLNFEQARSLQRLKDVYPNIPIIMQIHSGLLRQYNPAELAASVADCPPLDYVWLDASGGEGKTLQPNDLLPYIAELAAKTNVGIGLAGGLDANNVTNVLPPLLAIEASLSWDAQSGVQHRDESGLRVFDIEAARRFLEASTSIRSGIDQTD